MCNGPSRAPKAHEFLRQKSQILRSNSDVDIKPSVSAGAAGAQASSASKSRPFSALQPGTRPLSAQKSIRRPISAPRLLNGQDACEQKLARFQDAWVARRGVSAQKRKKPKDPFKDFLSDDPRIAQLIVERTMEDNHIRSCKNDLHHKALLGKLDAGVPGAEHYLNLLHSGHHSKEHLERALPPVEGLHKLQQHMIQSHKELCESNPEAMGSFIDKTEERRRRRKKENQEHRRETFKNLQTQSTVNLNQLKSMLDEVQNPKAKTLELWNTSGAAGFRNRFQKHHDHYMLENLDVAQAVRIYQERHQ